MITNQLTRKHLLLTLSFFSSAALPLESTFFDLATARSINRFYQAKNLPFNKALVDGKLPTKKFEQYLRQDGFYLLIYGGIANRVYEKLSPVEQNKFLIGKSVSKEIKKPVDAGFHPTFASLNYSQHLLKTEQEQSTEVMLAAMAPCQWLYGQLYQNTSQANRFNYWLKVYQTKDYQLTTNKLIALLNETYQSASPQIQKKMLEAFDTSMAHEVRFWVDAYQNNLSHEPIEALQANGALSTIETKGYKK